MKVCRVLFVLSLLPYAGFAQVRVISPDLGLAVEKLPMDILMGHLNFLGGDNCEGRATGTTGGEIAGSYLAGQLQLLGLKPLGDDASYFQRFLLHGSQPLSDSQFTLQFAHNDSAELLLGTDYLLYKTGDKTIIPSPAPLVFVGYGIVAPEYDYNDYQDVNVADAIVVFLSGEPESDDPDYFGGSQTTHYALTEMKQRIAISRGARGSIVIPLPRANQGLDWTYWRSIFSFEHVTLPYDVSGNFAALLNLSRAGALFRDASYSLKQVLQMDADHNMRSFPLNANAGFTGRFIERDFVAFNVVGMLEGSDPLLRDSHVIVSAHYDGLGKGPAVKGDRIYNGVVDNALGCSAVLAMARAFSEMKIRPKRSLVFAFLTGEEKGLLGSRYYNEHPPVPLYKSIANVNVDGLAIMDTFNDVVGVGGELSTLGGHLADVARELGLSVSEIPDVFHPANEFSRSDQLSFAQAGVPSILISEGFAYRNLAREEGMNRFVEWGRTRYHSPFDDLSQPINEDAVRQHAQVIMAFIGALAQTYQEPQWVQGAQFINARLQSIAEKR